MQDAGVDVPFSCTEGICGTCETGVLEGIPDHRDLVLTESEKAANDVIFVCCSGSKSPRLVLDA
jgi:ferredoxin